MSSAPTTPNDESAMSVAAAFWRSEGERLREGAEYWIMVGGEEPPPTRERAPG